jgi:energy-converting hydrogenase Eha subunit H
MDIMMDVIPINDKIPTISHMYIVIYIYVYIYTQYIYISSGYLT